MKIFLFTSVPLNPPWDQGDKNLAYGLTQALPEHQFQILARQGAEPPQGANLQSLSLYRSRHPTLVEKGHVFWQLFSGRIRYPSKSDDAAASNGASRLNDELDLYHLIYQPTAFSSSLNRWIPDFRRRPILHTVPAVSKSGRLKRELFFADRYIALTQRARQALLDLGLKNVDYIPAGIDFPFWSALRQKKETNKQQLGLAGRTVVLYPGHFGPGYGVNLLLEELPRLAADHPDLVILCAFRRRSNKDQEREQAVRRAAHQLGVSHNLHFYNTVADMRLLIGASDLTILPLETMRDKVDIPTTLLESLAAGVPVVISDLEPMNELLKDCCGTADSAGLLVPPGNAAALGDAITCLLADPGKRSMLADAGQALVSERFDISKIAREYDRIYREMAG